MWKRWQIATLTLGIALFACEVSEARTYVSIRAYGYGGGYGYYGGYRSFGYSSWGASPFYSFYSSPLSYYSFPSYSYYAPPMFYSLPAYYYSPPVAVYYPSAVLPVESKSYRYDGDPVKPADRIPPAKIDELPPPVPKLPADPLIPKLGPAPMDMPLARPVAPAKKYTYLAYGEDRKPAKDDKTRLTRGEK
jgi:hypothetical protein